MRDANPRRPNPRRPNPRRLCALTLALMLAACGGDGPAAEGDSRQAGGEVLEGSISDDMIALDELRSRGPSAEPTGDASSGSPPDDASTPAEEAAPENGAQAQEPADAASDD